MFRTIECWITGILLYCKVVCLQEITESSGENLLSAMDKVKACLLTPLKAYDETDQLDNLPHQIVKVLYKGEFQRL